mmetsp:Transcript_25571/g.42251  ORF Transcript_25571/g.42251 Transcript_25571/m.42251 type:complete len:84 (+) Transcript_25571:1073-1324(+)
MSETESEPCALQEVVEIESKDIDAKLAEAETAAGKEVVSNVLEVWIADWRAIATYSMIRPDLEWLRTNQYKTVSLYSRIWPFV